MQGGLRRRTTKRTHLGKHAVQVVLAEREGVVVLRVSRAHELHGVVLRNPSSRRSPGHEHRLSSPPVSTGPREQEACRGRGNRKGASMSASPLMHHELVRAQGCGRLDHHPHLRGLRRRCIDRWVFLRGEQILGRAGALPLPPPPFPRSLRSQRSIRRKTRHPRRFFAGYGENFERLQDGRLGAHAFMSRILESSHPGTSFCSGQQ